MDDLHEFVQELTTFSNEKQDIASARKIISKLNEFLYNSDYNLGTLEALGQTFEYFSRFHKYWRYHYKEILNLQIDIESCKKVANVLHDVYIRTKGQAFREIYDTCNLDDEIVCRIRLLTANQDFRGSRKFKNFVDVYTSDPSLFDEHLIYKAPENFVKSLGVTSLSQNDKRLQYAKNIAKFVMESKTSPFKLIELYNNDVEAFRNALLNQYGAGYGYKKANMFIRDMIVLGIWKNTTGFEHIDVASDVNTIKIALRTGILRSEIPLVSSFLDIFCYQYGYVDEMNAVAWREVWKQWNTLYPKESIASPCLLDYFIYNVVGRQFCKESLCLFECHKGHKFLWHSARNKTCQVCYNETNSQVPAKVIARYLPCEEDKGKDVIKLSEFYRKGIAVPNYEECPFKDICDSYGHKKLAAPKSISIMGQTGWTSAYSDKETGGGGLMA